MIDMNGNHEKYMKKALALAKRAADIGDVPVGALIVKDGKIISEGYNLRENGGGATAHAELLAIEEACRKLGTWRLSGCELYVTLEPCPMCAGAILNARLDRVVYGAADEKGGAVGSVIHMFDLPFGHRPRVTNGVLKEECTQLLTDFFCGLREE